MEAFIGHEQEILDGTLEGSLLDHVESPVRQAYHRCTQLSYEKIYQSKPVLDVELGGYKLMETLMETLVAAAVNPDRFHSKQIIRRFSSQYEIKSPDLQTRLMAVIYSQKSEDFEVRKGPIFANFILADEINRSPAKVQSALLEAMQERQVTIGEKTFKLPDPFLVMATQNPIEQEGTYPLPEAQVDRFMLKVVISYPKKEEEKVILRQKMM